MNNGEPVTEAAHAVSETRAASRLALKVDVDTFRGTREGVPALLRLFDRYHVRATFLFSLGPDQTGRALRRVFRRGFLSKVRRTSVVSHYGLKTLMYGVLLPGPHIGRRCQAILQEVEAAGHETGIHCHNHVYWQDHAAKQGEAWTRREMETAKALYEALLKRPVAVHGAAGWQINAHLLGIQQAWGLRYASDTRGHHPFFPVMAPGIAGVEAPGDPHRDTGGAVPPVVSSCLQLPTTLATLDELLGADGVDVDTVHLPVLAQSRVYRPHGHVYTLHAELEGMKLLPTMTRLLRTWQAEGVRVGSLANLYDDLAGVTWPQHRVVWGKVPGRSGLVAMQGEPYVPAP